MDSNSQKSSPKTAKSDKISDAKKPSSASPTAREKDPDKEYAPLHSAMKCKVTVPDPPPGKDKDGKDGKDGSDEDSEATQGSNRL